LHLSPNEARSGLYRDPLITRVGQGVAPKKEINIKFQILYRKKRALLLTEGGRSPTEVSNNIKHKYEKKYKKHLTGINQVSATA
jgi:hypothetical protein